MPACMLLLPPCVFVQYVPVAVSSFQHFPFISSSLPKSAKLEPLYDYRIITVVMYLPGFLCPGAVFSATETL